MNHGWGWKEKKDQPGKDQCWIKMRGRLQTTSIIVINRAPARQG